MRTTLRYGSGTLTLEIPDHVFGGSFDGSSPSRAGEGDPGDPGDRGTSDAASDVASDAEWVAIAAQELVAAGFVNAARGRVLGVLVNDGTRDVPLAKILPTLYELATEASQITTFVCTGTHAPDLPETRALVAELSARAPGPIVVHEARDPGLVDVGTTERGTRLAVRPELLECDLFLVVSDMKPHYFAGYSNPVKFFVPGLASFETARGNHSLALDPGATFGRHPWHPDPGKRSNPVAEDMLEGLAAIVGSRRNFAFVSVTSGSALRWAGAGTTAAAAGRGMRVVDETCGVEVAPARFLVVSAGGRPYDESLYTAQRALELTRAGLRPGGEVLFLAECSNGIGPQEARANFFDRLARPLAEVLETRREDYVLYSHKAWKFADYLTSLGKVHLTSELPPGDVESIHLAPAPTPQAVIDRWCANAEDGDRIVVLDDASKLFVR